MNFVLKKIYKTEGSITGVAFLPNDSTTIFVIKQIGQIEKISNKVELILDISDGIKQLYQQQPMKMKGFADERGLLSLAFHPEFSRNGSLFNGVFIILHSAINNPQSYLGIHEDLKQIDNMTCISQYKMGNNPQETKSSRRDILCYPEPQMNHNGGNLHFGPNGWLWVGTGDGGGANDEHGKLLNPQNADSYLGTAQNLQSIHGKMLRIGVVQPMNQKVSYIIPQNNPFANRSNIGRPEMVAWGFRNPWRMSFDSSGSLFIGDVGQNRKEMVKVMTKNDIGKNYGWRAYEGDEIFDQTVLNYIQRQGDTIVKPLISYPRSMGIAIVGVIRYEGNLMSKLKGLLIIADYSGAIMIGNVNGQIQRIMKINEEIRSMDKGPQGEIYISTYDTQNDIGQVSLLSLG